MVGIHVGSRPNWPPLNSNPSTNNIHPFFLLFLFEFFVVNVVTRISRNISIISFFIFTYWPSRPASRNAGIFSCPSNTHRYTQDSRLLPAETSAGRQTGVDTQTSQETRNSFFQSFSTPPSFGFCFGLPLVAFLAKECGNRALGSNMGQRIFFILSVSFSMPSYF